MLKSLLQFLGRFQNANVSMRFTTPPSSGGNWICMGDNC